MGRKNGLGSYLVIYLLVNWRTDLCKNKRKNSGIIAVNCVDRKNLSQIWIDCSVRHNSSGRTPSTVKYTADIDVTQVEQFQAVLLPFSSLLNNNPGRVKTIYIF